MKNKQIRTLLACLAMIGAASLSCAAQPADFNGTWKLNLEKSFLAGEHPASDYQLTEIITQKEGAIEQTEIATHVAMMNIPMPNRKTTMSFVPNGKEHAVQTPAIYPGAPPSTLQMSAEWQGNTLVIDESGVGILGFTKTHLRYFLSADGSQLIELLESHNKYGDTEQHLVFDRQN